MCLSLRSEVWRFAGNGECCQVKSVDAVAWRTLLSQAFPRSQF